MNILKNRFNDNIYFSEINQNLIYLNPFCNEEDTFWKEIKSSYRTINDNEIFIENGKNNIKGFHIYKTINPIIIDLKKTNIINALFYYKVILIQEKLNLLIKYLINFLK